MNNDKSASSRDSLALLDSILLAVLILAMCSQIDLRAIGQDTYATAHFNTKRLFIALSDVTLVLVFAWFLVRTTIAGAWRKLWWPPLPCWALIFAMILATVHSPQVIKGITGALDGAHGIKSILKSLVVKESKEAIVEILQYATYFIATPLLFVNMVVDRRGDEIIYRRRLAFHAFAGAVAVNILFAIGQRLTGSDSPHGLFGSPNIYGALIAFALPLLLAHTLASWNKTIPATITTLLCFAGALLTLTSLWAALALIIGLLTAGALLRQWARMSVVGACIALPLLLLWNMPSNLQPLRQQSREVASHVAAKPELKNKANAEAEPKPEKVKKQLIEWYAALGWGSYGNTFATGVGPGNYQFNIGSYYSTLPNEEKMPPDSNNLYLVQSVAVGILGLGTLLWIFGHFAGIARTALKENRNDWLAGGVLASLMALAFVNLFHATVVRGGGTMLAFVLSLAVVAMQTQKLDQGETDD